MLQWCGLNIGRGAVPLAGRSLTSSGWCDLLLVVEVHWSCRQGPEVNWQGSGQFGPGERYQETESKEGYSKH